MDDSLKRYVRISTPTRKREESTSPRNDGVSPKCGAAAAEAVTPKRLRSGPSLLVAPHHQHPGFKFGTGEVNRHYRKAAVRVAPTAGRKSITSILRRLETGQEREESLHLLSRNVEQLSAMRNDSRFVGLPVEAKCTIAVAMCNQNEDSIISTHGGDHTVKISSFSTGEVKTSLMKHTRTPWAVAIHQNNPSLIASGCLSGRACIWLNGQNYREWDFGSVDFGGIIMSLTFHYLDAHDEPNVDLRRRDVLLVACGTAVWLWDYSSETNRPIPMFNRIGRVQSVCFSPLGAMVTAEFLQQQDSQICFWQAEHSMENRFAISTDVKLTPVVIVSKVILYSDGGMSLSKCGRFLAAVRAKESFGSPSSMVEESTNNELVIISIQLASLGQVVRSISLDCLLSSGVTSVKFSPSNDHIVCGYGVQERPMIESTTKYCIAIFSNYLEDGDHLKLFVTKTSLSDDVNVAIFHPQPGYGILYGTRQGPLKVLGG